MNFFRKMFRTPFWIRLLHWEYWSFNTIYLPIYIVWVGLCLRARSFFFFAASNPSIKNGGFLNESKKDIAPLIPVGLHPRTLFFSPLTDESQSVKKKLEENGFCFPLIGKPDIGGRGRAVRMLKTAEEVLLYANEAPFDYHIQEFVPYEKEVGIFYYRYPGSEQGVITGIVRKEFLSVTGDGLHNIGELLRGQDRALLQMDTLMKTHARMLKEIPAPQEKRVVVPYGNHARGAKFIDDSALADEALRRQMDMVCGQIPEFYFGRLDIRYRSWEELKKGQQFAIIEVNGAGSEPTHIYDPRHSIFFAWRVIIRHWIILCRISRLNHRRGYPYLTLKQGIAMFKEDRAHAALLEKVN